MKGFKEIKCTLKKAKDSCKSKINNTSRVAIAGGTGLVGQHLTKAFLEDKHFEVILLTRTSSKNPKYQEYAKKGAKIVEVDFTNIKSLYKVLSGVHIVVSALPGHELDRLQSPLIQASKQAGVNQFVPSEFGVDVEGKENPFFLPKIKARRELEASGLEYTYYVTGFFMDLLISPNYGFHLSDRKVEIIGQGHTQFSVTSLSDIANFVVKTINLPESRNTTLTINGEITSFYKIVQNLNQSLNLNLTIKTIPMEEAQDLLANPQSDPLTKLFYGLRSEIESGNGLNTHDNTPLMRDEVPSSILDYIKSHPLKV